MNNRIISVRRVAPFVRGWLWFLLLLVLAWRLSGLRLGQVHAPQSVALSDAEIPQLDSFSEPAVAVAILQQHVQDLYFAYTLQDGTNDQPGVPEDNPETRERTAPSAQNWAKPPLFSEREPKSERESGLKPLCDLHGRLRALQGALLQSLMAAQFQNRSWNGFLDCYLELLAVAPEQVDLAFWAREALAYSRLCGKTDELLGTLQHFTLFGNDRKMAMRLQGVLEDWSAGRIQCLDSDGMSAPDSDSLCHTGNRCAAPTGTEP